MKTQFTRFCLAGLLALAFAACDDDETRDPPPFRSGVESEQPVSELTPAEKEQICEQYGAYAEANVDLRQVAYAVCLPTSLVFGLGGPEDCESYLNDCVSDFLVSGELRARVHNQQACLANLEQCDSSVVELEGCVNFNLNLVLTILERFSCRNAGDPEVLDEASRVSTVRGCTNTDRACGEFAEAPIE